MAVRTDGYQEGKRMIRHIYAPESFKKDIDSEDTKVRLAASLAYQVAEEPEANIFGLMLISFDVGQNGLAIHQLAQYIYDNLSVQEINLMGNALFTDSATVKFVSKEEMEEFKKTGQAPTLK